MLIVIVLMDEIPPSSSSYLYIWNLSCQYNRKRSTLDTRWTKFFRELEDEGEISTSSFWKVEVSGVSVGGFLRVVPFTVIVSWQPRVEASMSSICERRWKSGILEKWNPGSFRCTITRCGGFRSFGTFSPLPDLGSMSNLTIRIFLQKGVGSTTN